MVKLIAELYTFYNKIFFKNLYLHPRLIGHGNLFSFEIGSYHINFSSISHPDIVCFHERNHILLTFYLQGDRSNFYKTTLPMLQLDFLTYKEFIKLIDAIKLSFKELKKSNNFQLLENENISNKQFLLNLPEEEIILIEH